MDSFTLSISLKLCVFSMNKTLLRIVALLLIPCLIGDPVTASAFATPSSPSLHTTHVSISENPFGEQAFASRALFVSGVLFWSLKLRADVFHSIAAGHHVAKTVIENGTASKHQLAALIWQVSKSSGWHVTFWAIVEWFFGLLALRVLYVWGKDF